MTTCRSKLHILIVICVTIVIMTLLPAGTSSGNDEPAGLLSDGWREEGIGTFVRLPERKASGGSSGFSVEVTLAPGTGIAWKRMGAFDAKADLPLAIEMASDNVNATSKDYQVRKASFPLSVTLVFGKDTQALPFKQRVKRFFSSLVYGFSPRGIRLTYVFGNSTPSGSMYRLSEEQTVFTIADPESVGKTITVERTPLDDFRAAYARDPKGPVTSIIVRAERPSPEKGPAKVRLSLAWGSRKAP